MNIESFFKQVANEALNKAQEVLALKKPPLKLILAVSGGVDSCVMLDVFLSLKKERNIEIIVCHVNHGLRVESKFEEQFVCDKSRFHNLQYDVYQALPWNGAGNKEAWARNVRYKFLNISLNKFKADYILTAHHANDQAETILMKIISGRIFGVSQGISFIDNNRKLLRPFLNVCRDDILQYANEKNIKYVIDSSNEDITLTRNKVRNILIPNLVGNFNPQLIKDLNLLQERLNEDEMILDQIALSWISENKDTANYREALLKLSSTLRFRIYQMQFEELTKEPNLKISYRDLKRIDNMILNKSGQTQFSPMFVALLNDYDKLVFEKNYIQNSDKESLMQLEPSQLSVPGNLERKYSDGSGWSIVTRKFSLDENDSADLIFNLNSTDNAFQGVAKSYFDYDKMRSSKDIFVREWQNGDQMKVWRRGRRKIKKLFQEKGIHLSLRRKLPIIELSGDILWVPEVSRSDIAPIEKSTKTVLEITFQRF
jgi:tRNA(Ile)-lysidine synthase